MLDFAKKSLYIGLGLATMTKEKLESLAKDAADYAKLNEEEGRKLAEFLQAEAKKARENLRENVQSLVDTATKNLPSRSTVQRLEQRIAALEQAVGIAPVEAPAEEDAPTAAEGSADAPDRGTTE